MYYYIHVYIYVLKYQKEKREKKRAGKVLEEIMAENFPEYNEKILHIHEEQQTPTWWKQRNPYSDISLLKC